MIAEYPLATVPIAWSQPQAIEATSNPFLAIMETVLSQYANSPVLLSLIRSFSDWLDPASRFDAFFSLVWNIDTAQGWGLDVWGRILGVSRVLQVPAGEFLGFEQQDEAQSFGHGIFYRGANSTNNAVLTDAAYRDLLLAKAALNITNSSIPAINQILLNLFGDGYVRDNLDMTIDYVFSQPLSPVQTAIIYQSGVLPRPAGVLAGVETA